VQANTGKLTAEEVVQLYITDLEGSVSLPLSSLQGFKRIQLAAGASQIVEFEIKPQSFELVNMQGERELEPGKFKVIIGSSSPGKRGIELGAPHPVEAIFEIK